MSPEQRPSTTRRRIIYGAGALALVGGLEAAQHSSSEQKEKLTIEVGTAVGAANGVVLGIDHLLETLGDRRSFYQKAFLVVGIHVGGGALVGRVIGKIYNRFPTPSVR